jgi:serine/threonine protein kinase
MTPERHARIQQIFEAALDLPPARRDSYLRESCGDDEDLRRRIEQLIAADIEPETMPDRSVGVCRSCSRCYDGAVSVCPVDAAPLETVLRGSLLIDRKYLIERRLGHGGMGAVYQVRHTGLEKTFALKLILSEATALESYRQSFETEARALGALKHPNIVGVTDYGIDPRDGGVPYLVMEYLEGETLRQALKKRKLIPFPEAAPMLRSIAAAIDSAHAQNIIHADLKPGNLFLARQADASTMIKVVDFGLARLSSVRIEVASAASSEGVSSDAPTVTLGAIRGTPPYMAPELFRSEAATRATDHFAFGVVAFDLLTGKLPFGTEGCRSAQSQVATPSSLANLPPELDAPLLALLHPAPERRPATATAAVQAMEDAWLASQRREWRALEIPRRMVFSVVIAIAAVLLAALAARLPVMKNLEERIVDARFGILPASPPDPRLLVVAIDDPSLALDKRPLAQWSDAIGNAIERMFSSGARAVAIDILLPESWSTSSEFTGAVLRHADHLTLAEESRNGVVTGEECIALPTAAILGEARYSKLFGFVNLEEDQDHAIRHARTTFPDLDGRLRPSFAARIAGAAPAVGPFWIDYSVHPQSIERISYKDVARADFRDRIVFLGSTYTGSNDDHAIPASISDEKIAGVVLEAEIANTIAAGFPVKSAPSANTWAVMYLAALVVIALALVYPHRPWISLLTAGGVAVGYVLAAFILCRSSKWMIPVAAPELALLLAIGAAWTLKSRLSPYPGKD